MNLSKARPQQDQHRQHHHLNRRPSSGRQHPEWWWHFRDVFLAPGDDRLSLSGDDGTCFEDWFRSYVLFFVSPLFSSGKLNLIFRFHALSNAYDFLCNDFWRVMAMGFCAGGVSLFLLSTWILVGFRFHEDSRRYWFPNWRFGYFLIFSASQLWFDFDFIERLI